jgi:Secretion system C-terminal sorting domain/SdrD B-like domain
MKKFTYTLISCILLILCTNLSAQISGTVFRDYNGDGIRNTGTFNEPFVSGITVKATITNGSNFTTTTNVLGYYNFTAIQIPSGTDVRIEFLNLAIGDFSGFSGVGNKTNVQFITTPNSSVNFAVNASDDFYNNVTNPDPILMAVTERRGVINGGDAGKYTLVQLKNSSSGPNNPSNSIEVTIDTTNRPAIHSQTGSLFGLAYQSKQDRFFATALIKRVSDFGPRGPGGIYIASKSGVNYNNTASFTLQGVVPSNGGSALDFGSVTRSNVASNDNYMPVGYDNSFNEVLYDGRDNDAFVKAGTMAYGDIEADPQTDKLYTINLFQKKLIVIDASMPTTFFNSAIPAALAPYIKAYDISSLSGCPVITGAGNNLRPFCVKIYKGVGYLGLVSDAMNTQSVDDLKGYILQFDPQNIGAGFSTVLTIDFNLYAGFAFHPWITTWAQAGGSSNKGPSEYPQPIISGIEFNEDGSMDIGIRDRWGDQGGNYEFFPMPGATKNEQTALQGDLVHACKIGASWVMEGMNGSCIQNITQSFSATSAAGEGTSYNNNGKEYYADISGDGRPESGSGGLAKLMGTERIVSTVYDPCPAGANTSSNKYWSTQGLQWNNTINGVKTQIARVEGGNHSLDKANVMGDIEFVKEFQPIQIGNRVWVDFGGNGLQDAGDFGINGITVELVSPGIDGVFGNSDDVVVATQVTSTINGQSGSYFFNTLSVNDSRKPATWMGIANNQILAGFNYQVRIPNIIGVFQQTPLGGLHLTNPDVTDDHLDSDGILNNNDAVAIINTSVINHNLDFGFGANILPLHTITLSANKQNEKSHLNFTVTDPQVTNMYTVERSTNSSNFIPIGTVQGTTATSYSFMDAFPFAEAKNYYRIKLTDAQGKIVHSEIKMITYSKEDKIDIYPTPTTRNINISLGDAQINKTIFISLYNSQGQEIFKKKISRATATEVIDVERFSSGVYQLKIATEKEIIADKKIVIIK